MSARVEVRVVRVADGFARLSTLLPESIVTAERVQAAYSEAVADADAYSFGTGDAYTVRAVLTGRAPTIKQVSPYYYAVSVGEVLKGYAYSHPRCLPRSWSVRLADGTNPYDGSELRKWFPTRKAAAQWLADR